MRRFVALGVGAALPLVSSLAMAATYEVGPTKTYKQISAVATLLKPGDLVLVDGDATYTGGLVFTKPGTATAKITVRGVVKNGKRPQIVGGANGIDAQANHYVFEGLDITGSTSRCFFHHANDITLRDSVVHDCPQHGVLGADSDSGSLTMDHVEVYKTGGGLYHHQVYIATDEVAYPKSVFRMQYCYIHDGNGGNNVKSRAERNEIYYNWVEGAMYHEVELIGPDGQTPTLAREDSDVVGNVIRKTGTHYVVRFGGDGTGGTSGRYRFVNNTVVTKPGGNSVFRLFDNIESVEMHNNVFAVDGSGGVNLLRQTEANWTSGSSKIAGTNNWMTTGSINVPTTWTGTLSGASPGFSNLAGYDLRPTSSSPLVNAGSASLAGPAGYPFPAPLAVPASHPPKRQLEAMHEVRPVSGAIDIGAFEQGTASSPPPPPPPPPGTGGTSGAGGTGGTSAVGGAGGASSGGAGGVPSAGGATATGGSAGEAGSAGSPSAGGAAGSDGVGGETSSGGTAGTPSSGGAPSDGGSNAGGEPGEAGSAGAAAGSAGAAGEPQGTGGQAGAPSETGGARGGDDDRTGPDLAEDVGITCSATSSRSSGSFALLALAGAVALMRRRRAAR